MKQTLVAIIALMLAACAGPGDQRAAGPMIKEEPVTYRDGSTVMKGFIVYDDAIRAKRPGVVVVHEWWGITKHVHEEARKLAAQGYTAFTGSDQCAEELRPDQDPP